MGQRYKKVFEVLFTPRVIINYSLHSEEFVLKVKLAFH